VLARWGRRNEEERRRPRTAQSFCVPKAEIVAEQYDLSINRYKELVYADVEHRSPTEIIRELESLEDEIRTGLAELHGMLS